MELNIIILFSALSFIIYGYSSFNSKRMISEYSRWGFSDKRKIIGFFQFLGGIGLIIGIKFQFLLPIISLSFITMMVFAIIVRIKINDSIIEILPAITYLFLNIIIFYKSSGMIF
tara:strand:- start:1405 stop:1749 length:345 start_codon:yes stop_codon:yes gene_type:complete